MEISSIRQKISSNNNDHETDQHSSEVDNDTTFKFKFDHLHQSNNSNSDSPHGSPSKDSPADHLFRNGVLLPHSFPVQPLYSYQRSASRASSVGSKDYSLISSRSNSTNSRSSTNSCSSSARTSISDTTSFDRKHLHSINAMREYHKKWPQPAVLDHAYGSSLEDGSSCITPMPVMTQEMISSRSIKQKLEPQGNVTSTTTTDEENPKQ